MALITAVTLLALVSVAVASIGMTFALSAKRTAGAQNEAQLRQLLLAGANAALAHVNTPASTQPPDHPSTLNVPVPPALVGGRLTVSFQPSSTTAALTARVKATLASQDREEVLHLSHVGERWQVDRVTVN
jgi:hypothetical protein